MDIEDVTETDILQRQEAVDLSDGDWKLLITVYDAIQELSMQQRKVVHYYVFTDMSLAKTAKALGISKSTARNFLNRAKKRIKAACIARGVWHEGAVQDPLSRED